MDQARCRNLNSKLNTERQAAYQVDTDAVSAGSQVEVSIWGEARGAGSLPRQKNLSKNENKVNEIVITALILAMYNQVQTPDYPCQDQKIIVQPTPYRIRE